MFTKTLDNVKKQGLYIDLGGANVYVLGAGLSTSSNSHYISGKTLDSLQDFWRQWFAMSNANLVAFGAQHLTSHCSFLMTQYKGISIRKCP